MEYNFRDTDNVQFLDYCCLDCLTEDIIETWRNVGRGEVVEVFGGNHVIGDIFRELLKSECDDELFTIGNIQFNGDEYCFCGEYDEEYLLTINDDRTIWIQPAYKKCNGKDIILLSDARVSFVSGDCNSKILRHLEKFNSNVMIFDFEECE